MRRIIALESYVHILLKIELCTVQLSLRKSHYFAILVFRFNPSCTEVHGMCVQMIRVEKGGGGRKKF